MYSMNQKKDKQINVRVSEFQLEVLQKIVDDGKAKTQSGALIYLINQYGVVGK